MSNLARLYDDEVLNFFYPFEECASPPTQALPAGQRVYRRPGKIPTVDYEAARQLRRQGLSPKVIAHRLEAEERSVRWALVSGDTKSDYSSVRVLNTRQSKLWCMFQKGCCCLFCEVSYDGSNASIFTFDHRNPDEKHPKLCGRGQDRTLYTLPFAEMEAELAKCDLICANCHQYRRSAKY